MAAGVTLSAAAYSCGSAVCHQRAERSFHLDAAQLPVCARCTGLYLGAAVGASLWWWPTRRGSWRAARRATIAAALPTATVWIIEYAGVGGISNELRAIAAVPLGAALGAVVGGAIDGRLH